MNYLTLFPPFSSDNRALWKFQGTSADKQKYQYLNKLHIFKLSLTFFRNLSHPMERGEDVFFSFLFFFKALSPGALKEEFRTKRFIMRELRWVTSEGGVRVDLMKFTSFWLQKHELWLLLPLHPRPLSCLSKNEKQCKMAERKRSVHKLTRQHSSYRFIRNLCVVCNVCVCVCGVFGRLVFQSPDRHGSWGWLKATC